jgi:hypothetical protein
MAASGKKDGRSWGEQMAVDNPGIVSAGTIDSETSTPVMPTRERPALAARFLAIGCQHDMARCTSNVSDSPRQKPYEHT